ncbi:hypothetical protein [Chachezhania sediminis]|uniref:hypothetical protein n=1 Tax=Chachezhania sediminis TaxID=2599291 RepID=UPI00131B2A6B|nr:hypothetical protein [Chachezhania sediminis]
MVTDKEGFSHGEVAGDHQAEAALFELSEAALADWLLDAAQAYATAVSEARNRGTGETSLALSAALSPLEHHDDVSFVGVLLYAAERREISARREGASATERFATAHLECASAQAVRRWQDGDGVGALGLLLEILTERRSVLGVRAASELLRAGRLKRLDGTASSAEIGYRFVDLAISAGVLESYADWILSNIEGHPVLWDASLGPIVCVGRVRAMPDQWPMLLAQHRERFADAKPIVRRVNLRALVEAADFVDVVRDAAHILAGGPPLELQALKMLFTGPEAPLRYHNEAIHFGDRSYSLFDEAETGHARPGLGSLSLSDLNRKFAELSGEKMVILDDYDEAFKNSAFEDPTPKRKASLKDGNDLFANLAFEGEES